MSKKSIYPGDGVYTPEILANVEVAKVHASWCWSPIADNDVADMANSPDWLLEVRNIPLFRLGIFSPWTLRFYPDTELSRRALLKFAERSLPLGEFRNPSTRKLGTQAAMGRVRTVQPDRVAVGYRDLRVEIIEGNAHLVGTMFTANTPFGRIVRNHIAGGGKFRISLRSLTFDISPVKFNPAILKEITDVEAMDIHIDDVNTNTIEMFKIHSRDLQIACRDRQEIAERLHGAYPRGLEDLAPAEVVEEEPVPPVDDALAECQRALDGLVVIDDSAPAHSG